MDQTFTLPDEVVKAIPFSNLITKAIAENSVEGIKFMTQFKDRIDVNKYLYSICNQEMKMINLDILKFLIEELGGNDIHENGFPLRAACADNAFSFVKYLVEERKVDINLKRGCYNPINNAVRNGHLELVKYLLEHGADIKLVDLETCKGPECKAYIESIINPPIVSVILKAYFGIKVSEKIECSLPKLEEKIKDNEYYYLFLLEGPQDQQTVLARFAILRQISPDVVPEYYLM